LVVDRDDGKWKYGPPNTDVHVSILPQPRISVAVIIEVPFIVDRWSPAFFVCLRPAVEATLTYMGEVAKAPSRRSLVDKGGIFGSEIDLLDAGSVTEIASGIHRHGHLENESSASPPKE
jgi:hypothetical protein